MILSLLTQAGRAILKGIVFLADKFDYTPEPEPEFLQYFRVESDYYYAAISEFDVKVAFAKEMGRAYTYMETVHPWTMPTVIETQSTMVNLEYLLRMQMKLEPHREESRGFRIKMINEYGFQNMNH